MAQKVEVKYFSDLSPDVEASETLTWGLDGTQYEIDLTEKEANNLRKYLDKYKDASRKATGRKAVQAQRKISTVDTNAVREWARSQGFQVSDRGRIPNEIMAKYDAAN